MTAEDQIENSMLSIAKKSVLKTLCPVLSFEVQFPKLDPDAGQQSELRHLVPLLKHSFLTRIELEC
jgi:hypothetical protein